jgi:uncharacterized CHY-type Zn-finger protein
VAATLKVAGIFRAAPPPQLIETVQEFGIATTTVHNKSRTNCRVSLEKIEEGESPDTTSTNSSNTASTTNANTASTSMSTKTPTQEQINTQVQVHGLSLTTLTQCTHWNSPLDIIAIRHACCGKFYACISCHDALEEHTSSVWPLPQRDERAVLCGNCKHVLRIDEYLSCGSVCTQCEARFNPGCKGHWGMYFEMEKESGG